MSIYLKKKALTLSKQKEFWLFLKLNYQKILTLLTKMMWVTWNLYQKVKFKKQITNNLKEEDPTEELEGELQEVVLEEAEEEEEEDQIKEKLLMKVELDLDLEVLVNLGEVEIIVRVVQIKNQEKIHKKELEAEEKEQEEAEAEVVVDHNNFNNVIEKKMNNLVDNNAVEA